LVKVTRRQTQILRLAARGLADKEIAAQLGISKPTVRKQLQRFYQANGIHNRTAAVMLLHEGRNSHE
jgi:DNA-binding NarL/FixJ family response regulator